MVHKSHSPARRPDVLALVNGRVTTLEPRKAKVNAVLMDGGKIVAAGTDAEVRQRAAASARIIDPAVVELFLGCTTATPISSEAA